LLVGGERLSKTRIRDEAISLTQITPEALTSDFGVDPIRYHLLRATPLGTDGEFSYEGIVSRYNADLANNLGNLASRVATVVERKRDGIGPRPRPAGSEVPLSVLSADVVRDCHEAWARFAPQDALEATWRLLRAANAELERLEPWKLPPGQELDGVLGDALEVLRIVAVLVSPAMPNVAAELWARLGLPGRPDAPGAAGEGGQLEWGGYPGGLFVVKGEALFPRRTVES
jgi:methionyl-tRNA synthetase